MTSPLPDPEFWRGKRVFLTGHTGFKGSWLTLWLKQLGARVAGYALAPPTKPALFDEAHVADGITSIDGDIRDFRALRQALEAHRPEIVFHLAAQSVVRASYLDPIETYSTNVMGTVHLLDAMRHLEGPWALVNVTTDKVTRNNEWVWAYREIDALGGHDPYSNSKACSELVTESFRDAFMSGGDGPANASRWVATARGGNVIGGGDWTADQLVPDVIRAFVEGRPAMLRNPDSVRPWQFVLDCLLGYLTLAERLFKEGGDLCGGWNFGPEAAGAKTVREIVDGIALRWQQPAGWIRVDGQHPHEAQTLRVDASKARHRLDWRPRLDTDESLDWIVQWYRRYYDGISARTLCSEQIERFRERTTV